MKPIRRFNLVLAPLFLFVVIVGIALFVIRERLMPSGIGHELTMGPETSSPLIATNQFLVLIHPSHLGELNAILRPLGLEVNFPLLNWIAVQQKEGAREIAPLDSDKASIARLIVSSLLNNPLVLDAHHNFILEPTANKPWPGQKDGHLFEPNSKNPFALNLSDAWKITKGSPNVTIAVVDEFSIEHQFNFASVFPQCLKRVSYFAPLAKTEKREGPASSPHGEPLLQAIGACNNVSSFNTGVDHAAKIIAAEPASRSHADVYLTAALASGIDICKESVIPCPRNVNIAPSATKPDVVLLPLGNNAPELLQISADIMDAIKERGVMVVTGAGNDQMNANSFFPAASAHVISVGALNQQGKRAQFSNWGVPVDIFAPGDDIDIAYPNGLKAVTGTSMAAAYTAGTLALLKAIKPDLSFEEARHALLQSAYELSCDQYCLDDERCRDFCCNDQNPRCDRAALNPAAALRYVRSPLDKPILNLSQSYFLHLRDEPGGVEVVVKNIGGADASVKVTAFDEHIDIAPKEFTLKAHDKIAGSQSLKISFKREPFKRQIYKFAVSAYHVGKLTDRTEFFVEYVPRH